MKTETELKTRNAKPKWLKTNIPTGENYFKIKKELERRKLGTICRSAKCPNISECWNNRHATFLIMGDTCSRACSFCSVKKGTPRPLHPEEADRILEMVEIMGSKYVVITSVTRDDLEDGGSAHFAAVIKKMKSSRPDLKLEVLIPDFKGNKKHLDRVFSAGADVLNHNIETVKSLYEKVNRKPRNYYVSLGVLKAAKEKQPVTKSGIMVGLGETKADLDELFHDLRENGVDLLTIGQYLQPTAQNLPVAKFYSPGEFEELKDAALACGFAAVEAGPFVRSSYNAGRMYRQCSGNGR